MRREKVGLGTMGEAERPRHHRHPSHTADRWGLIEPVGCCRRTRSGSSLERPPQDPWIGTDLSPDRLDLLSKVQQGALNDDEYIRAGQETLNPVFRSWVTGVFTNPTLSGNYYYSLGKT